MSQRPKLPAAKRKSIAVLVARRRKITKLIAKLQDLKRTLPTNKDLAKLNGVCYTTVRRTIYGDYRTRSAEDEHARAA